MIFGRLLTALITPFNQEGQIDWKGLEACIERLVTTGTDAIVVAGTTAESPTLSHQEKLELIRFTKVAVNGKVKVLAGTGSNNTAESIALSKEATEIGIDGLMIVAPYYNKPSQEGLFQHFKSIAGATDLPLMVYNIPGRTGVNLSVDTMCRLAEIDRIVAFKEASGDMNQISQLISQLSSDIAVYSGDDSLTLPTLAVGGVGVVSVASHLIGKEIKEMIESYVSGDVEQARRLHQQYLPVFQGIFITSNPAPVKYALSKMGYCDPYVRQPLVELTEQEKQRTDDRVSRLLT